MRPRLLLRKNKPYQWRAIIIKPRWPEMVYAEEVLIHASAEDSLAPDVACTLGDATGISVAAVSIVATIRSANADSHDVYVNRDNQNDSIDAQKLRSAIRAHADATCALAVSYGTAVILGVRREVQDDYLPVASATLSKVESYHLFLPAGHRHFGFAHAGLMS